MGAVSPALTAHLAERDLVLPDLHNRFIGRVVPAALAAIGSDLGDGAAQRDLGIPAARHVVLVLIDGMGIHQITQRRGHTPFLRNRTIESLSAGFPSTTVSSLASLGTGSTVGQTGMVGYTCRNPHTGELANLISWHGLGDPYEWQQQPVLFEEASNTGIAVANIAKAEFKDSSLTAAALRGGDFIGAPTFEERINHTIERAKKPGLTYCYWSDLDYIGHRYGWQSPQWTLQLEHVDAMLASLAARLPRGAVMVVTSDHGMVDVTGGPRWDVSETPALDAGVDLVAGEPRALHLYTNDTTAVVERWQNHLGTDALVASKQEWIDSGVFGSVSEHVLPRIGDVVVAMAGNATVVDRRIQTPAALALVGMHGSLTLDERDVPWLVVE